MVTHDLDSLHTACNRIAVLGDGKIIAQGNMQTMLASKHPWLREYFHGKRARAALGPAPLHTPPPRLGGLLPDGIVPRLRASE